MKNKLLSLGTVVTTGNDNTMIMIDGYAIRNDTDGKIYDYSGVVFPIGMNTKELKLFNRGDIRDILFVGFETKSSKEYMKAIESFISNIRAGKSMEEASKILAQSIKF